MIENKELVIVNKNEELIISKTKDKKIDEKWLKIKFVEFLNYFNNITNNVLNFKNIEIEYCSFENLISENEKQKNKLEKMFFEKTTMFKKHRNGFYVKIKSDEKNKIDKENKEFILNYIFSKFEEQAHYIRNNGYVDYNKSLLYSLCSSSLLSPLKFNDKEILSAMYHCPVRTMGLRHIKNSLFNNILKIKHYEKRRNKIGYKTYEEYYRKLLDFAYHKKIQKIKEVDPLLYEEKKKQKFKMNFVEESELLNNVFIKNNFIKNLKNGLLIENTYEFNLLSDFLNEEQIVNYMKKNPLYKNVNIYKTKDIKEIYYGDFEDDLFNNKEVKQLYVKLYKEYENKYFLFLKLFKEFNFENEKKVEYVENAKGNFLNDKHNISIKIKNLINKAYNNKKINLKDTVEYYLIQEFKKMFINIKDHEEFIINMIKKNNIYSNEIFNFNFIDKKKIESVKNKKTVENNKKSKNIYDKLATNPSFRGNLFEKQFVHLINKELQEINDTQLIKDLSSFTQQNLIEAFQVKETIKTTGGGCKTDVVIKNYNNDYVGLSLKTTYNNILNVFNLGDITIENLIKNLTVIDNHPYKDEITFILYLYHNPYLFDKKFAQHEKNNIVKYNKNYLSFEDIEKIIDKEEHNPRIDFDKLKKVNERLYNIAINFFNQNLKEIAYQNLINKEDLLEFFVSTEILEKDTQPILNEKNEIVHKDLIYKMKFFSTKDIKEIFDKSTFVIDEKLHLNLVYNNEIIYQLKNYVASSGIKDKTSFEYFKKKGNTSRGCLRKEIFDFIQPKFISIKENLPINIKDNNVEEISFVKIEEERNKRHNKIKEINKKSKKHKNVKFK